MDDKATELIRDIAEGDEEAFGEFYRLFHANVYAFAIKSLSDPVEADEVLHEVMFEVWRGAKRFEGRSRALTWVLGITRNKVIDRLRKRGGRRIEELSPDFADGNVPSATDAVQSAQNADHVKECMEKLSVAHRQVVHLAFFEDLSYPEVARIVSCPEGTVKTRMFHAKQLLKRCLERF